MKEIYTEAEAQLCPTHRKCIVCRNEVENGKFIFMNCGVACLLPEGTPNRLDSMCAFQCSRCKGFFLKQRDLCKKQYDNGAGDNDPLFCERCPKRCVFCHSRGKWHTIWYKDRALPACLDCDPEDDPPQGTDSA